MNHRRWILVSLIAALAVWGWVAARPPQSSGTGLIGGGPPPNLFLLSTGDVIGYLETCGCKKNPSGGLARRAWVIGQLRDKYPNTPQLLLDSGNFSDIPTPQGDEKTRGLLEGMDRLGYLGVNVGERDIKQGYAKLVEKMEGRRLRLTSANILRKEDKKPAFEPHLVLEALSPDGRRKTTIGVVGAARFNPLFKPKSAEGPALEIAHPMQRVKEEVEALKKKDVELIVLLTALHREDARRILGEVPDIDFVVGSYGGVTDPGRERVGKSWIVYTGNQGKNIAISRIYQGADGQIMDQTTRLHMMTEIYPAHQGMLDFVNEVTEHVDAMPKPSELTVGASSKKFVGSSACKECHAGVFEQWLSTGHSSAFDSLVESEKSDVAGCQPCHVTGFEKDGGFASLEETPDLARVGCESCHGLGSSHLANTAARYGKVELPVCTGCHNLKNSPDFDYYSYLPRIKHSERDAQ